jgi:phosphoribosyl 1,2-cyclic phosphodiesterase
MVLLDAGLSAKRIMALMYSQELDPAQLDAVVITHEHGDHVRGVRVLAKRLNVPVYMTQGTFRAARDDLSSVDIRLVSAGDEIGVSALGVRVFETDHDAAEPVGCVFEDVAGSRLGIMTDTGHMTRRAAAALESCHVLGIESNHDVDTLNRGPYPWFLKERILSDRGHLSNLDAGEALASLAGSELRQVIALHLSNTNNTADLAHATLRSAIEQVGGTTELTVFAQGRMPTRVSCR